MKEVVGKAAPAVRENFIDKAIRFVAPVAAARRFRARLAMEVFNAYDGASKKKRSLKSWVTMGSDADSDILPDLATLRERSRDLVRNNPLAGGAIKTKVTNVIGTGLRFQSRIDRKILGLSDEQAEALESTIEREWRLFWDSKDIDLARAMNGHAVTRMVYRQEKENGDVFILLPRKKRAGCAYDLKLQVVEADRVCNKDSAMDSETLAGGIEKDADGAPVKIHIMKYHPGALVTSGKQEWQVRDAFNSKTGLRNIIHFYNPTRPGQSRGMPDLAAVIEPFKQLGRYTEAEIMAAVVSGFFTVFIESDIGGLSGGPLDNAFNYTDDTAGRSNADDKDLKLGNGLILELAQGEKVHDSNPGRPNTNYDQFVLSILRQIGVGLELPFEILVKHFTASYSAARAALLELWKYVLTERQILADNFLRPVQEVWMYEAVAAGRIAAPGFFSDPAIRKAYLGGTWVGPAKGQIDEFKEMRAAKERLATRLSTLADETAELTGGDWESNHIQQVKERNKQIADGLIQEEKISEEK